MCVSEDFEEEVEEGPEDQEGFLRELFASNTNHIINVSDYQDDLKSLAYALLQALGELDKKTILLTKFLDSEEWEWKVITGSWPKYMTNQGFYAVNKFFDQKDIKVKQAISFNGEGGLSSPWFKDIEIEPNKFENLMQEGWVCFYLDGIPVVFDMYEDNGVFYTFRVKTGNEEVLNKAVEQLRDIFANNNLYKGRAITMASAEEFTFVHDPPKLTWNDIIVDGKIKTELERQVITPINDTEYHKKYKLPWRRGVLLEGLPGTGKTLVGKLLLNEVKATFIYVSAKAIRTPYDIKIAFEAAKMFAPTIIFFEDIDLFAYNREQMANHDILGELLSQMDGVSDAEGIFVLAATNRKTTLDQALVNRPNRFDLIVKFDLPDVTHRTAILNLYNTKFETKASPDTIQSIATQSDKLTPAYLREIVIYAKMLSVSENRPIDEGFVDALKYIKQLTNVEQKPYG